MKGRDGKTQPEKEKGIRFKGRNEVNSSMKERDRKTDRLRDIKDKARR